MTAPALSAAGARARAGDEPRFLAALCAPAPRREPLFALIALNLELARIPATVSEPMLGEIRLQWWAEALEALAAGRGGPGSSHGHEALAALAAAPPADMTPLFEMVESRRLALAPGGMPEEALDRYLAGTAGALLRAEVAALEGGPAAAEAAALAGWAEGAGRLVAALPALAAEGAGPLGPDPAALRGRIAALAAEGLSRLAAARALRGRIPRGARAPFLSVHLAERTLRAAARPGYDPLAPDAPSPFRMRAGLLLRAFAGRF